MTIMNF
ncbi:unnamed protein product [Amaranthus hypochondriacus]